jgi:hypothetical protein
VSKKEKKTVVFSVPVRSSLNRYVNLRERLPNWGKFSKLSFFLKSIVDDCKKQ